MEAKSYYSILQVSADASEKEIQKSFRKLALIYHPDKSSEQNKEQATRFFQELTEAFATLGDPVKRRQYDLSFAKPHRSRSDMYGGRTRSYRNDAENNSSSYDDDDFFAEMERKGPSMWSEKKTERRNSWGSKAKSASNFYKESRYFKKPTTSSPSSPDRNEFVDERITAPQQLEARLEDRDGETCIVLTWKKVVTATSYKLQMRVKLETQTEWKTCYEGGKRKVAVNGLEGGVTYEFCVCACNKLYSSVFSKVIQMYCPDEMEDGIVRLEGMGFARAEAMIALRTCGGDFEGALEMLLKKPQVKKKKKKKKKSRKGSPDAQNEKKEEEEGEEEDLEGKEQEEMLQKGLIKCSRCKDYVDIDRINDHECDADKIHLLNFASVVGDKDLEKLRTFLQQANGELNAAVDLYYSETK